MKILLASLSVLLVTQLCVEPTSSSRVGDNKGRNATGVHNSTLPEVHNYTEVHIFTLPEETVCSAGEVYNFVESVCIDRAKLDRPKDSDGGPSGTTCGPREVYCIIRQQCIPTTQCDSSNDNTETGDGGKYSGDNSGDWREKYGDDPEEGSAHCGRGQAYCFIRNQCVDVVCANGPRVKDGICRAPPKDNERDSYCSELDETVCDIDDDCDELHKCCDTGCGFNQCTFPDYELEGSWANDTVRSMTVIEFGGVRIASLYERFLVSDDQRLVVNALNSDNAIFVLYTVKGDTQLQQLEAMVDMAVTSDNGDQSGPGSFDKPSGSFGSRPTGATGASGSSFGPTGSTGSSGSGSKPSGPEGASGSSGSKPTGSTGASSGSKDTKPGSSNTQSGSFGQTESTGASGTSGSTGASGSSFNQQSMRKRRAAPRGVKPNTHSSPSLKELHTFLDKVQNTTLRSGMSMDVGGDSVNLLVARSNDGLVHGVFSINVSVVDVNTGNVIVNHTVAVVIPPQDNEPVVTLGQNVGPFLLNEDGSHTLDLSTVATLVDPDDDNNLARYDVDLAKRLDDDGRQVLQEYIDMLKERSNSPDSFWFELQNPDEIKHKDDIKGTFTFKDISTKGEWERVPYVGAKWIEPNAKVTLKPARDYAGEIRIRVTPVQQDVTLTQRIRANAKLQISEWNGKEIILVYQVEPVNDAPHLSDTTLRLLNSGRELKSEYNVPFNKSDNKGILVSELVKNYFEDIDGPKVGLAVLMAQSSQYGTFQYKDSSGGAWKNVISSFKRVKPFNKKLIESTGFSMEEIIEPAADVSRHNFEVDAVLLPEDYTVRFAPNGSYVWSKMEALRSVNVLFTAWDQSGDETAEQRIILPIPFCKPPVCGSNTSFAMGYIQVTMYRLGCDGKVGSRAQLDRCGVCGGRDRCLDCNGDVNGGARRDKCADCFGGNTGKSENERLDCGGSCTGKFKAGTYYKCLRSGQDEEAMIKERWCDGVFQSKAFENECGKCVNPDDPNADTGKDQCGVCGGKDECVDCRGEINGKYKVDSCRECLHVDDPNFDKGCSSLGKFSPKTVHLGVIEDSKVEISTSKNFPENYIIKSCWMLNKAGARVDMIEPTTKVVRNRLFVSTKVPRNASGGEYTVNCTFTNAAGEEVIKGSNTKLQVVAPAQVTSLIPDSMNLGQESVTVTVKGTGFVTDKVWCYVRCDGKLKHRSCKQAVPIITFPATKVNETTIECNSQRAKGIREAVSLDMGVLLKWPKTNADIEGLSTKPFTIIAPKPSMTVSTFKPPCRLVTVFDVNIEVSTTVQCTGYKCTCSDLFNTATIGKFGTDPECQVFGKRVAVRLGSSASIIVGDTLTLKENAISSRNAEVPNYATGSITLEGRSAVLENPTLVAPKEVGSCDSFGIRARIPRKASCGSYNFTWSVALANGQNSSVSATQSVTNFQRSKFNSLNTDRVEVAGNELEPGFSYKVTVNVTNKMGSTSGGSVTVTRSASAQPVNIRLLGGDRLEVDPTARQKLVCRIKISKCSNVTLETGVKFIWTGISNSGQTVTFPTTSIPRVVIPPGTLFGGQTYTFTLSVIVNNDYDNPISDDVIWSTASLPLVAKIVGPKYSEVNVEEHFTFDASSSYDPNSPDVLYDEKDVRFKWNCTTLDPETRKETGDCYTQVNGSVEIVNALLDARPIITIAPNTLSSGTYKFTVTMMNGVTTATAFTIKTLRQYQQQFPKPDIRFDGITSKVEPCKPLVVSAKVSYAGNADTLTLTWESVDADDYESLNLTKCLAGSVKEQISESDIGNLKDYELSFKYNLQELPECCLCPSCKYKIGLIMDISHSSLESNFITPAETDIEVISAPSGGNFEIPVKQAVLFESHVTACSKDWDQSNLNTRVYKCPDGKTSDCKPIGMPFTSECSEVSLPFGLHNIRMKTCNADNGCVESENSLVNVTEPENVDPSEALSNLEETSQSGEVDPAAIKAVLEYDSTSGNSSGASQELTQLANTILTPLVASSIGSKDSSGNLDRLEGVEGIEFTSDNQVLQNTVIKETVGLLDASSETSQSSGSSRKRRAATSQEPLTALEVEDAEILLTGYQSVISESSSQDLIRDYLKTVHQSIKGICRGMSTGLSYHVTDGQLVSFNLAMRRFNGIANEQLLTSCTNCTVTDKSARLILGQYIEDRFAIWNCSDGVNCYGGCLATVQFPNNIISINSSSVSPLTLPRRSDVVGVHFINPEANKMKETEPYAMMALVNMTTPVDIKIPIFGAVNTTLHSLQCHKWDPLKDWTTNDCTSSDPYVESRSDFVTCSCTSLGYVAVFEAPPAVDETTVAPTTTVAAETTTSPTLTTADIETTTREEMATSPPSEEARSQDAAPYVNVTFKLNADYNTVVGNNKTAYINHIKPQVALQLGVNVSRITNMDVKAGSIVVMFTLIPPSSGSDRKSSAAINQLQTSITSGSLTLTDLAGNALPVIANSMVVTDGNATPTTTKSTPTMPKSKTPLPLIIGVTAGGVVLIVIIVVTCVCIRKKQSKKVSDSPRSTSSSPLQSASKWPSRASVTHSTEPVSTNPSECGAAKPITCHTVDETDLYDLNVYSKLDPSPAVIPLAASYRPPSTTGSVGYRPPSTTGAVGYRPPSTIVPSSGAVAANKVATKGVGFKSKEADSPRYEPSGKRGSQVSLNSETSGKGRLMVTSHGNPVYDVVM